METVILLIFCGALGAFSIWCFKMVIEYDIARGITAMSARRSRLSSWKTDSAMRSFMVTTSRILNTEYNGADVYRPRLIFAAG